jgi:hypothetical protein
VFSGYFQKHFPYIPPVRPEDPDSRPYKGRDHLSGRPPTFQETLRRIQEDFNQALWNGKRTVPEHVDDQPFHFDYVDSALRTPSLSVTGDSFIGITAPLVNEMEATSKKLCGSEAILSILCPQCTSGHYDSKALFATLVRIQLQFAVSHEYAHHFNGDILPEGSESVFSNEIVDTGETGSLDQQVCEIDADGVATYLVLSDLIKGGSRPLVVRALNLGMEPASVQDEVLFLCFVVAAASFFFVRKLNNNTDFFRLTHPPQSVRMMYLMHSAVTWCIQFRPGLEAAVAENRFRALMDSVATATSGINSLSGWGAQVAHLSSESGIAYLKEIRGRFYRAAACRNAECRHPMGPYGRS